MGLEDLQDLSLFSACSCTSLSLFVSWQADLCGWTTSTGFLCSGFLLGSANRKVAEKGRKEREVRVLIPLDQLLGSKTTATVGGPLHQLCLGLENCSILCPNPI